MSRPYDFTLAAAVGSSQLMHVAGSVVKMISTPGGPVQVKTGDGDVYQLEAGQGFKLKGGKTFRELVISNVNGIAQTGSVFIGDDTFEDTRIPGQVQVIDGAIAATAAETEFIGAASGGGVPAAGQYTNIQIWNGSTASALIIKRLFIQSSTLAQSIQVRANAAQCAGTLTAMSNKRLRVTGGLSSGPSIGLVWRNTATITTGNDNPSLVAGYNHAFNVPAGNVQTELPGLSDSPILIAPGCGLIVAANTAASDIQVMVSAQIKPWIYGTP